MKKRTIILMVLIAALMLAACKPAEKLHIRDFDGFKNMPNAANKLVVDYEDDLTGEFEITDEAAVKQVMELLLGETYVRSAKSGELGAGGNGTMTVVCYDADAGTIEWRISLHKLEKGGYYYTPEEGKLVAKLREIGLEYGALKAR
jgi:hypothetical protein